MNYKELIRQLGKAGLNCKEFAELLKVTSNSITNLKTKEIKEGKDVPKNLAIISTLLGEMAERGIDYKGIIEKIDFKPQKSRNKGIVIKKKQ